MRHLSEGHKAKISAALKGKVDMRGEKNPMFGKRHSAVTKAKISAALKDNINLAEAIKLTWQNPECRAKHIESMAEVVNQSSYRAKLSAALRGRCFSEEHKAKISAAAKNRPEEWRTKISAIAKNRHFTKETRAKLSAVHKGDKNPMFGKHHSAETRTKIGLAQKQRAAWHHSPETIRKIMGHIQPNKPERKIMDILTNNFPGEWKYTGDGSHTIGSFPVDFTNINGKKAVIELFGDYWHNRANMKWHQSELGRIMVCNSLGFRCLVIWEHELKEEKQVIDKIKQFSRGK